MSSSSARCTSRRTTCGFGASIGMDFPDGRDGASV
jgi:hypothetical protein